MNELVIADHLSLVDDGLMEGGMSSGSRDDEGVPSRTQTIVDSGRLTGELWSTRDAAKLVSEGKVDSAQTTGSASRGGPYITSNLRLQRFDIVFIRKNPFKR